MVVQCVNSGLAYFCFIIITVVKE